MSADRGRQTPATRRSQQPLTPTRKKRFDGVSRPQGSRSRPPQGKQPLPQPLSEVAEGAFTRGQPPFLGTSATNRIEVVSVSIWKCGRK